MTQNRRSGQITAIATLHPSSKLPSDELVQTFFIGNPVARGHTGKGVAQSAASELIKIVDKESISTQLVPAGTDGQYCLGFPQNLREILNLKKAFFYWDPSHQLAENDVKTAKIGNTQKYQFPFFTNMAAIIKDFLVDAKYGKKYEHIVGRRGAVVTGVEHISTIVLVNI